MINIQVKIDDREIRRLYRVLGSRRAVRAQNAALNRTARTAMTAQNRAIRKYMSGKENARTPARKQVANWQRLKKSTFRTLRAIIWVSGRALNIYAFGGRQTGAGISATAWGERKVYDGTFEYTSKYSGQLVAVKRRRSGPGLRGVSGPIPAHSSVSDPVVDAVNESVEKTWPKNLVSQYRRLIRQVGAS